jgi:hypothetical protein
VGRNNRGWRRLADTLLNVDLRLLLTPFTEAMIGAIQAAISPYAIAVARFILQEALQRLHVVTKLPKDKSIARERCRGRRLGTIAPSGLAANRAK